MSLLDLFASSPFKPMQRHMATVLECVRQVPPLFEALCAGDLEAVKTCERRIDELEGEADKLKNDLRSHLPKRLLLPVDRRDLLEILDLHDTIADTAQDIGQLLVEREMEVPESMRAPLGELVQAVERACLGQGAVIDELGRLEERCDDLESRLRRELFALEDTLSPVSVMFWYQLIDWLGDLADLSEKAGNRIRLLIAR